MFQIIGIVIVIVAVFGGYLLAGGHFDVIAKAAPFEMLIIMGSAIGAFIIGNSTTFIMATVKDLSKFVTGPKWKAQDYLDLLCLMFVLTKTMKSKGLIALESHIDNPKESTIFSQYPRLLADHFCTDFICDTLRMMTMNFEDPYQVETAMETKLEKHHHEVEVPAHAIQTMADALPALGIVAAVLGIIKTMGAITEPPAVLGKMIGGALVGTFLGVFLAYGFVGPISSRLSQIYAEEAQFYQIIRDVLVAHLHGNAAQISVEIGRGKVPTALQPNFFELEEAINEIPPEVK